MTDGPRARWLCAPLTLVALFGCASSENNGFAPDHGDDGGAESGASASDAGGAQSDSGSHAISEGGAAGETGSGASSDGGAMGPTPCGSTYCHDGQVCMSGQCVYAGCTGAKVPGDYATVQAAVTALAALGGTICVGPQTATTGGAVTIFGTKAPLTIVGVSETTTMLQSLEIDANGPMAPVTIQGIAFAAPSTVKVEAANTAAVVNFTHCAFAADTSHPALNVVASGSGSQLAIGIFASKLVGTSGGFALDVADFQLGASYNAPITVTLDGDDLSAPGGTAADVGFFATTSSLELRNSYLHDSAIGLQFLAEQTGVGCAVTNDTFERDNSAFAWGGNSPDPTKVFVFNDVFHANGTAITTGAALLAGQFGNNALFDNTTNYAGMAVVGPGYVLTDPMLDTSTTPPGLLAGSPCRGAGNAAHAPATDYWGNARGSSADVGAVQGR